MTSDNISPEARMIEEFVRQHLGLSLPVLFLLISTELLKESELILTYDEISSNIQKAENTEKRWTAEQLRDCFNDHKHLIEEALSKNCPGVSFTLRKNTFAKTIKRHIFNSENEALLLGIFRRVLTSIEQLISSGNTTSEFKRQILSSFDEFIKLLDR